MEVVASAVGSVLAEPCRFIFGFIHTRTKNFFKRRSNVSSLKNEMTSLMGLRDVVRQRHDGMRDEDRDGLVDWLVRVDEFDKQVDELVSTISATEEKNLSYSCFFCPMLCKLSGQLVRKIESVKELKETGNSLEKMEFVSRVEHNPGPSIISQETASENVDRLLALLRNDGVTRIGVWGMGGVGKTTLVKNLNNELEKRDSTRDLGMIIWVTVSKETNVSRIQMQIAERLNMKVDRSEERMKFQLHERLQNEGRFLLILDDVWEAVDLDLVGIPRPEQCAKGKIIITSRSLDVCREMETQENMRVEVLDSKEAWELFCEHAGEVVLEEQIRPIAQLVANECDGLPLAIIVVGASMRGKSMVPLWKNALRELKCSEPDLVKGIEDKVYKILKWSYDSLQGKHTKSCFLFCCLYPEDYDIEVRELVRYWYCEGLLDERLDYEGLENRGIAVIQSLKDCCLLEPGRGSSFVKMHDVVRDVGIWIASSVQDECRSLVRSGIGLTNVSESEFMYGYKRVSFMRNQFRYLPEGMVQCPEASTLLLQENDELEGIPDSFLHGFGALKILDMSGSRIEYLPSLAELNQLRALILNGCSRLLELPPLDGLSRLLVLGCSRTGITQLPKSIEKLSSLRELDMGKSQLQSIPYSAISKLLNLEVLRLPYVSSSVEGQRLFEVLPLLKKLVVLDAQLGSIPHLSSSNKSFNWSGSTRKSQILICNGRDDIYDWKNSTDWHEHRVALGGLSLSQESIGWLLCEATSCELSGCQGITQMFKNSISAGIFKSLKVLRISHCEVSLPANNRGCVDVGSFDSLPNLEEIHLSNVDELESISDFSKILGLRFLKLRVIGIRSCPNLNCLLFLEENQTLENVKNIEVYSCGELKRLFNYPNTGQHKDLDPILPNLERVALWNLPKLENLCRNNEHWENLQLLDVRGCHGIKKLPLNLRNTESIKEIKGGIEWWEQLDWESEDIKMQLQGHFTALEVKRRFTFAAQWK